MVCPGRYGGHFSIDGDTDLIGAGSGDDPASNTILDAQGSKRALTVTGPFVSLTSVRLTGGKTNEDYGGGLLVFGDSETWVSETAIAGNQAGYGGGIAVVGILHLDNSTVAENEAKLDSGGGVYVRNSSALSTIENSTIEKNTAQKRGRRLCARRECEDHGHDAQPQ